MDMSYEYEDEYGYDDDYYQEEEPQDDEQIELENIFTEAEDNKAKEPALALEQFRNLMIMEELREDQSNSHRFECLFNIVCICIKLKQFEGLSENVTQMIELIQNKSKNEAQDCLYEILDNIQKLPQEYSDNKLELFQQFQQELGEKQNLEQLWLTFSLKLSNFYLEQNNIDSLNSIVNMIEIRLKNDNQNKYSNIQQELYSVQIQQCLLNKDNQKLKQIYVQCKKNTNVSSIVENKSMAIIKETIGKLSMLENNYRQAENELLESFKLYQEIGSKKAKQVLIYLVISGILSNSQINPFYNREAQVYQQDQEIVMLQQLRKAFETKDTEKFQEIIFNEEQKLFKDEFNKQFIDKLKQIFSIHKIQQLIKPYKRIKLKYLAERLFCNEKQVKQHLIQLILDDKIQGLIDEVDGYFENHGGFQQEEQKVFQKQIDILEHMYKDIQQI